MLIGKVKEVQQVFSQLEFHLKRFNKTSPAKCPSGCNLCCQSGKIEAVPLEFLPLAYELFLQNRFDEIQDKLEADSGPTCVFFNPFLQEGGCSSYKTRGLICRLFGYSIRYDKNNQPSAITCKILKEQAPSYKSPEILTKAPVASYYYSMLYGIDPMLGGKSYPINEAIKQALSYVFIHTHFRRPRKAG